MGTKEQIEVLEAKKLDCARTMRQSDEHLIGCQKKGKDFRKEYPEDYEKYLEANKMYNQIEDELVPLYEKLEEEERAEQEEARINEGA